MIAGAILFPSFAQAADSTPALTVRESGAFLYARQDNESEKIATLQKDEALTPIGHAAAAVSWYLVRTQSGAMGWVQASDVVPSDQLREALRERPVSTWSARTNKGRTFAGTWTVEPASTAYQRAGTWTLRDGTGQVSLRGTWLAQKSTKGWTGVWHAIIDGQTSPYGGNWSTDFAPPGEERFAELFEAAARDLIRGAWNAADHAGSWAIRAAK